MKLLKSRSFWLGIALILIMLGSAIFCIGWSYRQKNQGSVELGVSFSTKYADELGIEWQDAYTALLDVGIDKFRLMSYWDIHEPKKDKYVFDTLDQQMDIAEDYGAKVTLALGQRQPRWPECHIPSWVKNRHQQLLEYLEVVVKRYRNHPALESFQLENEAANRLFGHCPEFNRDELKREFNLVKSLTDLPVHINASNQSGIPLREPVGDRVGFSIYKRAHFLALGKQWPWNFWYVPWWWHSFRAALTEEFSQTETFIHELQAEPWGPEITKLLSSEEQAKTMNADKLEQIVAFAKNTGMKEIYLWGGEWWYWRFVRYNDTQLWQTVEEIFE